MFSFDLEKAKWTNKPEDIMQEEDKISVASIPETDFWQKTFYGYEHHNGSMLLQETDCKSFSFTTKVLYEGKKLYDQCGLMIYQDKENWVKISSEYKNNKEKWLGCVVTNNGYSDWSSQIISSEQNEFWFRLSRNDSDYYVEYSIDGKDFSFIRMFHLFEGGETINFGLYLCSPLESSFVASFSDFEITESVWKKEK